MYPQPKPRERGIGAIPSLEKIQKITPEWQTERLCSVDSVVSRVKGAHHDGDVVSWTVFFCCQIRWYRELFRPVWRKEPFLLFQGDPVGTNRRLLSNLNENHPNFNQRKKETKDKSKKYERKSVKNKRKTHSTKKQTIQKKKTKKNHTKEKAI